MSMQYNLTELKNLNREDMNPKQYDCCKQYGNTYAKLRFHCLF